LAAIAGTFLCLCFREYLVGSLFFLVLYNAPHLAIRVSGFNMGWMNGLDAIWKLRSPPVERAMRFIRGALSFGLGVIAGAVFIIASNIDGLMQNYVVYLTTPAALGGLLGAGVWLFRKRAPMGVVVYLISGAVLGIGALLD
jgi:mannose/fructose/N-acetylgalactosamine-specific phosphotransferase system component IID